MKTNSFISVIFLFCSFQGCSKEETIERVEITYQAKIAVNDELCVYDKVGYDEIIGYDSSNYTFLLTEDATNRIKEYFFPTGGLPFILKVMGEPIYSGRFFPGYSQSMPCGIYIDPYNADNKFVVMFTDDFCRFNDQLIDNRNDNRLITILEKYDKIISIDN